MPILRDGKLVGIVSRSNLVQALATSSSTGSQRQRNITRFAPRFVRLAEQHWTGLGDRNIIVVDGVAHVWGLVGSPSERKALIALAEGVPGVTRVRDEMIPVYH